MLFNLLMSVFDVQHLEIRNTLDIMHCEKFFCENILKTICGWKEKDSVRVRRDMQREGIRPHLWMTRDPGNPSRMLKPRANYVLTPEEFDILYPVREVESSIRVLLRDWSTYSSEKVWCSKITRLSYTYAVIITVGFEGANGTKY